MRSRLRHRDVAEAALVRGTQFAISISVISVAVAPQTSSGLMVRRVVRVGASSQAERELLTTYSILNELAGRPMNSKLKLKVGRVTSPI